jgi:hypothetical protein
MRDIDREKNMNKKRLLSLGLITLAFWAATAHAARSASEASVVVPAASGVVVLGSMSMVAASAEVSVKSIEAVGDGVVLVLKGASDATTASIKLTGQAAKELSVATGTIVKVVAASTGHLLVVSGNAIAFIPNEVGTALIHHSKVK